MTSPMLPVASTPSACTLQPGPGLQDASSHRPETGIQVTGRELPTRRLPSCPCRGLCIARSNCSGVVWIQTAPRVAQCTGHQARRCSTRARPARLSVRPHCNPGMVLTDTAKRALLVSGGVGLCVAAAGGYVWWQRRQGDSSTWSDWHVIDTVERLQQVRLAQRRMCAWAPMLSRGAAWGRWGATPTHPSHA